MSVPVPTRAPDRRAYGVALLLLAAGGALLVVAYGLTWATAEVPLLAGSASAVRVQDFSGRDLMPAAAMAGWIALAAVAGIVATRSWGRSVVAAIALVAGLVGTVGAIAFAAGPSSAVDGSVTRALGVATEVTSTVRPAWIVAVLAGVVVAVAAVWTLARGRGWPALGSRYERRPATAPAVNAWDAQDRGQDPTDVPDSGAGDLVE